MTMVHGCTVASPGKGILWNLILHDGAFCVVGVNSTFDLGKVYVTIADEHVVNI